MYLHRVSCFSERAEADFRVQTFEFSLFCESPYTVEPDALRFLRDHGFDFNKQISHGIPYTRACEGDSLDRPGDLAKRITMSRVFDEVLSAKKPVVLHNGLLDLAFLYSCFCGPLPVTLTEFTSNLSELFIAGVFDTKVVSEFQARDSASFLEYLYRKSQRTVARALQQAQQQSQQTQVHTISHSEVTPTFSTSFLDYNAMRFESVTYVALPPPRLLAMHAKPTPVCPQYSAHGVCRKSGTCKQSHDLDDILDEEEAAQSKRKRKRHSKKKDSTDAAFPLTTTDTDKAQANQASPLQALATPATLALSASRSQGHRAGFDAFMTGYCFAYFSLMLGATKIQDSKNKIYLSAKPFPLQIRSQYTTASAEHSRKLAHVAARMAAPLPQTSLATTAST
jgi:target of EGR1 protein 1